VEVVSVESDPYICSNKKDKKGKTPYRAILFFSSIAKCKGLIPLRLQWKESTLKSDESTLESPAPDCRHGSVAGASSRAGRFRDSWSLVAGAGGRGVTIRVEKVEKKRRPGEGAAEEEAGRRLKEE
jgi:hypothetical protein